MYDCLICSGGSLKGLASIGALYYVNDKLNTKFKYFYGTSIGSAICYLIALGYTPVELFKEITKIPSRMNELSLYDMNVEYMFDYNTIEKELVHLTLIKVGYIPNFDDLFFKYGKELNCISYNYSKNKQHVFNRKNNPKMSCLEAIRASCALPYIFKQFFYEDDLMMDGGIVNNLPIQNAVEDGHTNLLAINLKTPSHHKTTDNYFQIFINLFHIVNDLKTDAIVSQYTSQYDTITIYINFEATQFNFTFTDLLNAFLVGYVTTVRFYAAKELL